jgi:hypothetical protein
MYIIVHVPDICDMYLIVASQCIAKTFMDASTWWPQPHL